MSEDIKNLNDDQIEDVTGGIRGKGSHKREYRPYNEPDFPIRCPKCESRNIWYIPGTLGSETNQYWCRDCDAKFEDWDVAGGANGSW